MTTETKRLRFEGEFPFSEVIGAIEEDMFKNRPIKSNYQELPQAYIKPIDPSPAERIEADLLGSYALSP